MSCSKIRTFLSIHHDISKIREIALPDFDVVGVVDVVVVVGVEVDVAVVVVAVCEIIIKI